MDDGIGKCLHFVDECTGITIPHNLICGAVRGAVCTGNNNRVRDVVFILYSAFRTEYFQTLVIAVYCLTAVVNNTDCAVFKGQRNNSGIDMQILSISMEIDTFGLEDIM